MTLHKDSFFVKGRSHLVCEDYAINNSDFGVVSDGCSSVRNTDLGSRFLSLAALKHKDLFLNECKHEFFEKTVIDAVSASEYFSQAGSVMYATLGVLADVGNNFEALVGGDGFVVARKKDGSGLRIVEVDYGNRPFYPVYSLVEEDLLKKDDFLPTLKITTVGLTSDSVPEVNVRKFDFKHFFVFDFSKDIFDLVAVTTDGLSKFIYQKDGIQRVSYVDVAQEIFGKITEDEQKRFFGVKALEDGLIGLTLRHNETVQPYDDFAFSLFLNT